jgi:hypothetical protein
MHPETISRRYAQLRAEIKGQMSASQKWRNLPAMLDQLHMLRTQYLAAQRSFDLLTEDSEKLAFRTALH